MSGWDDNPLNFRSKYANRIIPTLVFDECKKWWVPEGTAEGDATDGMKSCLNNWYDKHITAFDLYMSISYWKNVNKSIYEYVDIDDYTEMETQLGGDMYQKYNHVEKLRETNTQKEFFNDVKNEFGGLRSDAI